MVLDWYSTYVGMISKKLRRLVWPGDRPIFEDLAGMVPVARPSRGDGLGKSRTNIYVVHMGKHQTAGRIQAGSSLMVHKQIISNNTSHCTEKVE